MKEKIIKILSPEIDIYGLQQVHKKWIVDEVYALRYQIAREVIGEFRSEAWVTGNYTGGQVRLTWLEDWLDQQEEG